MYTSLLISLFSYFSSKLKHTSSIFPQSYQDETMKQGISVQFMAKKEIKFFFIKYDLSIVMYWIKHKKNRKGDSCSAYYIQGVPEYIYIYKVYQNIYIYTTCTKLYIYRVYQNIYIYTTCTRIYIYIQGVPEYIYVQG